MRRIVFILATVMTAKFAAAQKFTLQQCIDTAVAANLQVQQNKLLADNAGINLKQARANRLPTLGAGINHGISQGRSIDPSTNGYINQSFQYAGYNASSEVTLFNNMRLSNIIQQYNAVYNAGLQEWQQEKDNLVLNVVLAYLQVLNNEDVLNAARNQLQLSTRQYERLQVLDNQGAIKPSDVADMKGQVMNDQLTILNATNALNISRLTLLQLMNMNYTDALELERISTAVPVTAYEQNADEVYNYSLKNLPAIRAASYRSQGALWALKAAKSELSPTLYVSGNMNTNYSGAAQNAAGKIGYSTQLKNNLYSSVNLGISIPIFNRFSTRNKIKLAGNEVKNAELNEAIVKMKLQQQTEQAWLYCNNAADRCKALQEQVAAYGQSLKAAQVRFEQGVGSSVEYLTAKNNYDRASINLISAQYEYLLRRKILDYYAGK